MKDMDKNLIAIKSIAYQRCETPHRVPTHFHEKLAKTIGLGPFFHLGNPVTAKGEKVTLERDKNPKYLILFEMMI